MKISLVTIFDTINFGTYLQAFATAVKLQNLGADVEVLWYERIHNRYRVPFENKFHFLKALTWLYAVATRNKSYFQKKACRRFVAKNVNVTKLYYTYEELKNNPPKADVFLTGSDQVWNTIHNFGIERIYYLEFVPNNVKKIAFSASFGMSEWDPIYKDYSKQLLSRYDAISVRETKAVDLLSEIGLHSQKVVDPTFLLSKNDWIKFAAPYKHKKPYVIVYSVEQGQCDKIVSLTARQVAEYIGGDVIEVNYVGESKQIPDCDVRFHYATPETFLSLMLGASFAVVSSFHGTAFSINLHIPFISVAPERFTSRIDSLLVQTETFSRKISTYDEKIIKKLLMQKIDFNRTDEIIFNEVKTSETFIKEKILNR
ncbi:polysaccharide pyruvyl transferase family protein [Prevotella sp. P4-119]|uniref:polysaccharide pyruvyl transferase family protein n=1 Tax=Prevotella sp. P4-119 TaxID=2024218 RepID=UPI000B95DE10|nr:polysaccharide pyruvyl transferase family protein [Prevotella sp. P4-119]OYP43762.1 hypothetical protein CIK89_07405 [Prevotella sp. P4-119]